MRITAIFISVILWLGTYFSSWSLTTGSANEADVGLTTNTLLSMHLVHSRIKSDSVSIKDVPENYIIIPNSKGQTFIIKKIPIFTEKDFSWISLQEMAYLQQGETIEFSLSEPATKRFGDFTTANIGKQFAIVVKSKIISAPVIQMPILGGKGLITGNKMRELYYSLRKVVKTKNSSFYCEVLPEKIQTYFKCI